MFSLYKLHNAIVKMDSYINTRPFSLEYITIETLQKLLDNPDINNWNRFFNCNEKSNISDPTDIFIEIH
jgi:hypothetical protein